MSSSDDELILAVTEQSPPSSPQPGTSHQADESSLDSSLLLQCSQIPITSTPVKPEVEALLLQSSPMQSLDMS